MHNPYEVSSAPASGAAAVTPADGSDLPVGTCRAVYVGVTGNLKVTMANGDVATLSSVPVGTIALALKRVWSTGTTASSLVALY